MNSVILQHLVLWRSAEEVSFERIEFASAKGLFLAGQSYKQKRQFCCEPMNLFGG